MCRSGNQCGSNVHSIKPIIVNNELTSDNEREQPVGGDIITAGEPTIGYPLMTTSINHTLSNMIVLSDQGRMMVSIDTSTGAIEFGEDYSFDEASRIFWTSLAADSPLVLKEEIQSLGKYLDHMTVGIDMNDTNPEICADIIHDAQDDSYEYAMKVIK